MINSEIINELVRIGSLELYAKKVRKCIIWGAATAGAGMLLCVSNDVGPQIAFGMIAGHWLGNSALLYGQTRALLRVFGGGEQ